MPSGRTHDRITLWSLPWIIGFSCLLTRNGELTLIVASGFLFSGLMFGPDLDIYSRQYQRWGKLRFIWLPYQKYLRHRSLFSHGFVIGTILRVIYLLNLLLLIAIPGVAIAQFVFGFDWNWQIFAQNLIDSVKKQYYQEAIALWIGLELGAMSHSLSDWVGSAYKRIYGNKSQNNSKKRSITAKKTKKSVTVTTRPKKSPKK